ncbi:glycosyltransferase, partial [Nocardiopsis tropica]|nr:glycosyltransferase [Nocardiopsis tropica]
AFDRDDMAVLTDLHRLQERLGIATERLTSRECRRLEPVLAPSVRGGVLAPDDHSVDPRLLLRALAEGAPPDVTLTVAGEFWGGTAELEARAAALGIADRVRLLDGYVPAEDLPGLFGSADAVVLPYRTATATQNVWLAHEHGLPVVATRAGTLADHVREGVDGLLCEPGDAADLARALGEFYAPGEPARLRAGVRPVDADPYWRAYT